MEVWEDPAGEQEYEDIPGSAFASVIFTSGMLAPLRFMSADSKLAHGWRVSEELSIALL